MLSAGRDRRVDGSEEVAGVGALDGQVALVTGGASGIGLATARRLRAEGARVAVVDMAAPPDGAAEVVLRRDVAEATSWPEIVAAIEAELGGIDLAHLNAGVTTGESVIDRVSDEQWRRIMRVNVDHVFFGIRALVPAMERRGGGVIVATASLAGLTPFDADPVYTMTKHAVVGLVRGTAPQLRGRGIRVLAICPGIVATPMVGDEAAALMRESGFPLLAPEEVADAVARAVAGGGSGECWFVQPGREPGPFEFRNAPGPRTPGAEGMRPPPVF